ncbi:MAG: group 1 truncated hemoglobin [Gammaproteobacteria bacterium]|nr:group 1 truncated hemoglobin [Gammaproteobacteria bacterium]MDH5629458.1 group 1 truncated hemoglobin [Gammaproteobacteria bacterium]
MTQSLYERLGGTEGITAIADTLVENHLANPVVSARYAQSDKVAVKNGAATFFIAGTGGPNVYKGKDMIATHKGMNISGDEFMAVLDDAMEALDAHNVGQTEKDEVLCILYSMRKEIMKL